MAEAHRRITVATSQERRAVTRGAQSRNGHRSRSSSHTSAEGESLVEHTQPSPLERSRFERRLGSKANEATYKFIINQIPPHNAYIEPFLGWGAIMLHKAPANHSICLDKEAEKVSAFLLELTTAQPTIAARIVGFGDALWSTIGTPAVEIPTAKRTRVANKGKTAEARSRHHTAALVVGDALSFLASYNWRGDEFVYLDPPYLQETRSSRHRYLFELDEGDHVALLDILLDVPAKIMLSGYASELYRKKLHSWRLVTFEATTRGGTMRTEHLWCNFPEPVELHDYRYIGKNFRERQDIKRMKQRWVKKLSNMPVLKQRALLSAINEVYNSRNGRPR